MIILAVIFGVIAISLIVAEHILSHKEYKSKL